MKTFILLTLLVVTCLSYHKDDESMSDVLNSSPENTVQISPKQENTTVSTYHRYIYPGALGDKSQWIKIPQLGVQTTFQTLFYSSCPQSIATVVINADDSFTAYLNGQSIGQGANRIYIYSFKVALICGVNNLTISTQNKEGPGAVIFKIVQNQQQCHKCHEAAFYNKDTCQCQCRSQCPCSSTTQEVYLGYPTCGCRCSNALFLKCNPGTHHYNEQTCSCECHKKVCPSGMETNPQNCECKCKAQKCADSNFAWDYDTCDCVRISCIETTCPSKKMWSLTTCGCICKGSLACGSGTFPDPNTCSCLPQ